MPTNALAHSPEQLYAQIRQVLQVAQTQVQTAINHAMVQCYWEIGRMIVEYEQGGEARAEYGKQTLQYLSNKLSREFGKGFDERNLRYIRAFYLLFPIRNALSSKLTWTHYRHLLRVENPAARDWYANEAITQGWSTRAPASTNVSLPCQRRLFGCYRFVLTVRLFHVSWCRRCC